MLQMHDASVHGVGSHEVTAEGRRPTSQEWDAYRGEITRLYRDVPLTLPKLIEYMQETYNFVASPRQFQERFRQWKVRKNITDAVRDEMRVDYANGTLSMDDSEKKRLRRQIRSHPDRNFTKSTTTSSDSRQSLVTTPCSSAVSHSRTSLIEFGSGMDSSSTIDAGFAASAHGLNSDLPLITVTAEDSSIQPWRTNFTPPNMLPASSGQGQFSFPETKGTISYRPELSISPSPSRMPSSENNAEVIFLNIQQFCDHLRSQPALSVSSGSSSSNDVSDLNDAAKSEMSSALVQRSTNDLKDIIYLYKIGNFSRADKFLQSYCDMPFEFVIDQSVDFLRQIITTLAPINTTRSPAVRHRLLEHLYKLTNTNLGPWHPLTVICKHLRLDKDSLETSTQALRVVQNSSMLWSRMLSFRTELDLVVITRRQGDLDAAQRQARLLIDTSSLVFGPESMPVRKTKLELSCIHIAQQDYTAVIEICRQILGPLLLPHNDMLSVRAMENIAEVYRLQSRPASSAYWLEQAADLLLVIEDSPVAATHIVDKLFEMLSLNDTSAEPQADGLNKIQRCGLKFANYL